MHGKKLLSHQAMAKQFYNVIERNGDPKNVGRYLQPLDDRIYEVNTGCYSNRSHIKTKAAFGVNDRPRERRHNKNDNPKPAAQIAKSMKGRRLVVIGQLSIIELRRADLFKYKRHPGLLIP